MLAFGNTLARIEAKDGRVVEKDYLEFWGEDASAWSLPFRCKVCPDAIGEAADLAAADTWPGGAPKPEDLEEDEMILNMGPQHPSTHGVLRLNLELEGEIVRRVKPIIGYLHTGMEKTGEQLTYLQGPTNVTRMDYASPLFNELVFSLATAAVYDSLPSLENVLLLRPAAG